MPNAESCTCYAARTFDGAASRKTAMLAGRRLIALAHREQTGVSWRMTPKFPRVMPNFSHGTAGVAHFLATPTPTRAARNS